MILTFLDVGVRLAAIDRLEAAKRRKEEARNTLEGYLYRLRDLLDDEPTSPFMKCSQEQERLAIREKIEDSHAWLHEDGEDADTNQYLDRRAAIEWVSYLILYVMSWLINYTRFRALEKPIIHRYKEIEEFPRALNDSQRLNWSSRLFLTDAKNNLSEAEAGGPPSKYTREELDSLEKTLKDHEKWLNEMVEKQKSVKMNEDPVLESSDLREKVKPLETQLQKLVKKKMPRPKKTATKATSSSSSTSSAEETTTGGDRGRHEEL